MNPRAWLALMALGALAGCATPLETCLSRADQDVLAVQRDLNERRDTLRRGYSVELVLRPVAWPRRCDGAGAAAVTCLLVEPEVVEIRHPINPTFESERIALLETQLARAGAARQQAAAQCRATYPE